MKALSPEEIAKTRFENKYEFERAMGMRAPTHEKNRRTGQHAAQKEGRNSRASGISKSLPKARDPRTKCTPKYMFQ